MACDWGEADADPEPHMVIFGGFLDLRRCHHLESPCKSQLPQCSALQLRDFYDTNGQHALGTWCSKSLQPHQKIGKKVAIGEHNL